MTSPDLLRVIGYDRAGADRRFERRLRQQAQRTMRLQPDGSNTGRQSTLLVLDPAHPERVIARTDRIWRRILSRPIASRVDRQIASGRSTDSSRVVARRAHALVSPAVRGRLARDWEGLLTQARRPRGMHDPRVPFNSGSIMGCENQIVQLISALSASLPLPARGVAMASQLLSDGAGPLYNRRRSADLDSALRSVLSQLDPSISLIQPGGGSQ